MIRIIRFADALAVCCTFLASALAAQPRNLATDSTGSVLYFVTDHMRLGEPDTPHGKVFRWDRENGVRIFWQEPKVERQMGNSWSTNYYRADDVSLSGDGGLLAMRATGESRAQPRFPIVQNALATIRDAKGDVVRQSQGGPSPTFYLSRNGKFFLQSTPPSVPRLLRRFDSDIQVEVPFATAPWQGSRQMVSDEGHVVYQCNGVCLVTGVGPPPPPPMPPVNPPVPVDPNLRTPITRRLPASVSALAPAISASGNTVIYESLFEEGQCRRLFALDVKTGKETLLFVDGFPERAVSGSLPNWLTLSPYFLPLPAPMFGASIDDAGASVLLLARENSSLPRQWLLSVRTDGTAQEWFGFNPEGYREAVLSGDGRVAFAVTENGRILRFEGFGEGEELLPRTPYISRVLGAVRPGAVHRIRGGGLADVSEEASAWPAPTSLGGVSVELDGKSVPLLAVSPMEIAFQIPWEKSFDGPTAVPVRLIPAASSSYAAPPVLVAPEASAQVEPFGVRHLDGSPVTPANPASAGEDIRVLVSGFVEPRGTTGVPAPSPSRNDPSLIRCTRNGGGLPAPTVTSFGLAASQVGLFEIGIRLPEESIEELFQIACWQGEDILTVSALINVLMKR